MKKNIIYIIIILLATLDIFTNYNIVTKFSLLFLCLLILFLSIKNKIPKTFPKIVYLLVFYFITYFLFKFFRYNLVYAVKSIFILIKIFAFPLLIYFICQNKDKDNQKSSLIFLLILSLIMIIKMILSHTLNLEELILILSCLILIYPAKEWLKYIIIIITISLSLIFKNNLLLLYAAILIITSIYFHMRNHQTRKGIVILSILLIFSLSSFLFLHTPSLENKTNYVINDYEFPIHPYEVTNINTYNDFISSFKTTDIKDITWGYNYHFINLSDSIITVFLHLGILGFLLYISLYYYLLKKLHILNNPYIISIIIFCFMTNIIYLPIMALIIGLCLRQEDVKEEEYATIFTLKKLLLLIGIIVLSFLLPFLIKSSTSNIIVDLELQNTLKVLNDYELDLAEENHYNDEALKEDIYYYYLKKHNKLIATIIFSQRNINGVVLNFITINNQEALVKINLTLSKEQLTTVKDFASFNERPPYSTVVGYDKKLLPIGYFKDSKQEMILGRSISYKPLISNYEGGNKSVVYDLISQEIDFNDNKKEIIINPNTSVDNYVITSENPLFASEDSLKQFIDIINNNSSWLTYKGNLYKIQYSIDPFTREGYSKILGKLIEEDFYNASLTDKSPLFQALSENAFYVLYNYTPRHSSSGIWLTEYTSTWLSKDYGTKAYYIDTRYNETIGYLLLTKYEREKKEKYLEAFLAYADFIYHNWQNKEGVYTVDNLLLMQDYFAYSNKTYTHSSFNHQLALINYLFKAYEVTNDKRYYQVAKEMLNNIIGFKDKWIKENGDLWYQVNQNGVFSGTDYEIVTLEDLLFTQNYLWQFDKTINKQIMQYIESKITYLQNNKISIPQNDIKNYKELKSKI